VRLFLWISSAVSVVVTVIFLIVSYQSVSSYGAAKETQRFEVRSGEDAYSVATRLAQADIVASRFAFLWYLQSHGALHGLVAGEYELSGVLSNAEVADALMNGRIVTKDIKVTFPEGWTIAKMADRLSANGLPGDAFVVLAKQPVSSAWRNSFEFLSDLPADASLEGFLFPDTYRFAPDATASDIIEVMLSDFDQRVDAGLRKRLADHGGNMFSAVILASIIEGEVRSADDRRMVSDIFLRRLAIGQPLQSDATIKYILGIDKIQHSFEETRTISPYNTYTHKGLPPGPISNPSLDSLQAVADPKSNPYFYFLSDPNTGETVFSKTFDEHRANKSAHGL
jgi:UPF0755 protein